MSSLKVEAIVKGILAEQLDDVRESLARGQVEQWIHHEVERYITALSRADNIEERKRSVAQARTRSMGLEEMMTVREVSGVLKVNPITVRKYVRIGALEGSKVVGRIMIVKDSVTRLLRNGPAEEESPE